MRGKYGGIEFRPALKVSIMDSVFSGRYGRLPAPAILRRRARAIAAWKVGTPNAIFT
jgi:hypothetical protein